MKKGASHQPKTTSRKRKEIYFAYSATLRIFGDISNPEEISDRLGLQPTHSYRRGEFRHPGAEPYNKDMWLYRVPVDKSEPLHVHIDTLWSLVREHKQYLRELSKTVKVDVFLGYRSNCDHAGVEVPHQSLTMFQELEIPFGLSIIVV